MASTELTTVVEGLGTAWWGQHLGAGAEDRELDLRAGGGEWATGAVSDEVVINRHCLYQRHRNAHHQHPSHIIIFYNKHSTINFHI